MAKVKLVVDHPSWDEYKRGELIEIDEDEITDRIRSLTKPYVPQEAKIKQPPKSIKQGRAASNDARGGKPPAR